MSGVVHTLLLLIHCLNHQSQFKYEMKKRLGKRILVHVLQHNPPQDAVLTISLPKDVIVLDIINMRRAVEDHALSL